ncbi:hypothetical protein GH714_010541 [Hevea brasiliensis]|uniref:Uncharacterized protein n=1 Tax=Hevea brasiliensis TaxID=3981 RepID=A0A6A6MXX0_HEVBR|nr:hypothetical protein GH714_010541 [Hevea brasiliensis]
MRNQTLQCEIEKQRIREEIIAKEIARRRVLEAEVRRELMMEREMAMRVGIRDGGLSSEERLTMRLEQGAWFPCVNQFDNRRLEDRSAFHGHGVFDQWPRLSEALVLPDVKPVSEDNKDKLIVLVFIVYSCTVTVIALEVYSYNGPGRSWTCAAWHVNNYNIEIVMGHWILASMSGTQVDVMWAVLG